MSLAKSEGSHLPRAARITPFSVRAFTVFGVTFSFLTLLLSGVLLFLAPKGRTAIDIDWSLLGAGRSDWEGIHIAVSLLFVGFCLWHLALHARIVRTLVLGSAMHPGGHPREILLALAATLFLVVAALTMLPPASWLIELNEYFKQVFWLLR